MSTKPIERAVLRQINRVAHAHAIEHEKHVRAVLMDRMQLAKRFDVSVQAKLQMIEKMASERI